MAAVAAAAHAARGKKAEAAAKPDTESAPAKLQAPVEEAQEARGIWKHQPAAARFYSNPKVQWTVASLIAGNFLCNIIEKWIDPRGEKLATVFLVFETFFNLMFSIELVINMYAYWLCAFWKSGWNIFDVIVVSIGLLTTFNVPLPGPFSMLRMMRAFRVFRLFKRVKSLNKIMTSLAKAVPGVMNAFFILLLVMSIYAILAVEFFMDYGQGGSFVNELGETISLTTARGHDYGHEYFGNFGKSLYTMFQVLTGESWSEAVARPLLFSNDPVQAFGVSIFFSSFVLVNGVVLINVVVAVLLEKMVDDPPPAADAGDEDRQEEEEEEKEEAVADTSTLRKSANSFCTDERMANDVASLDKGTFVQMQADVDDLKADMAIIKDKLARLLAAVVPSDAR
eukprot:gb/GFBE01038143.1/.p1 GENE.gb/GFBE01038143.1/~~gb/GFBE01038143.1/.p1  ORF type:complete len:396 (+),score=98.86 gb/GFBE01038143.1/:1-1188(+)